MSLIINIFYYLFCTYSIYTILDAGITYVYLPKIHYTTEYDLRHILSNSNFTEYFTEYFAESQLRLGMTNDLMNILPNNTLKHVMIDRTTNLATFEVNCTYYNINNLMASTEGNTNNLSAKGNTNYNVNSSQLIYYGLFLPQDDATNMINRLLNGTDSRIEYYDKQDSILEMFTMKTILYYIVILFIIKICISLLFTQQMDPIQKMIGDIDMAITVDDVPTKFNDVVGLVEAKQQIKKYVDIIKNRDKYSTIGATIPKGVLLCGPPGCGKTLLAKAVAGEAGVTFIAICGSDFDEVFIGVGSSRVKKLFELARQYSPCIVFIDEIDSIGEKRNSQFGHGADTLNKILAEMDGFKSRDKIMVLASTNRESHLDAALLRSGRFDSKIYIDPPNRKERADLYKLYLQKVKLDESLISMDNVFDGFVDPQGSKKAFEERALSSNGVLYDKLAKMTPGGTGADVANICNQAAINAVSDDRNSIKEMDIYRAIDDVMIGIEKKSKQGDNDELAITAYHEAGHALIGYLLKNAKPPMKVSIIPRGQGIAGYTQPEEQESNNRTREDLIAQVYMLLGGRCAEVVKFNKISTGAGNDFEKATKIIETMITKHGMYDSQGPMIYDLSRESPYCVSDARRYEIESLIQTRLLAIYKHVITILENHLPQLNQLSEQLLEHEIVDYSQIKEMFPDLENSIDI